MTNRITSGLMSSDSVEWATPWELFNHLDSEFHFTLDVCASKGLEKCDRYFTPEIDGLSQNWDNEICWMNPPYGSEIKNWVEKASKQRGGVVVALLPNRTDTKWYKQFVEPCASEIRLIAGRVKFGNAQTGAPFPSMIAIWGTPRTPRYGVISWTQSTPNTKYQQNTHNLEDF